MIAVPAWDVERAACLRREGKTWREIEAVFPESLIETGNGRAERPVKLDLGTRGRTSHPSDTDAGAIKNDLVATAG